MAKLKVRKSVPKAGTNKAPRPGRLDSRNRTASPARKLQFGFTVSKSVTPESNSKPGSPAPTSAESSAKNGVYSTAEPIKSNSGLDLTEKIKELVRLAQEHRAWGV